MKKFMILTGLIAIMAVALAQVAWAAGEDNIQVILDGLPLKFDVEPIIKSGSTLVPFRAVAEALNIHVHWDEKSRSITAADGENNSIWMQVGNKLAYKNKETINLAMPPQIEGNRSLIPLRFFSEAFGCQVAWNDALRRVSIISPPKAMEVVGFYALGDRASSSWTNLFGEVFPEHEGGNAKAIDRLAAGWYALDGDGNLLTRSRTGWQRPDGWERVIATASFYGLNTEMVVHEVNWQQMLEKLLADETAVLNMVEQITAEAAKYYDGVNLDLEELGFRSVGADLIKIRDNFTAMVNLLAASLHKEGLTLTLTLHPPNSVYKAYDYEALARLADRIIVMAYDYGAKPEPPTLVAEAMEQALRHVAAEKLMLGISLPSEDANSLVTKIGLAKRYQLKGIALWRLGLVSESMWQVLHKTIK